MRINLFRFINIVILVIVIFNSAIINVYAEYEAYSANYGENISSQEYVIMLTKVADPKKKAKNNEEYLDYAVNLGIIAEKERDDLKETITREQAAVYGNRVDEILNGKKYNKDLYNEIIDKKRLSDINKISREKRSSVIKMFSKGIMIGTSNGKYEKSRKFEGKKLLTKSEAALIINRVKSKNKRRKLSNDGQLIRVNNLPQNYRDFEYILESFPNSFYEMKLRYKKIMEDNKYKLKEYENYVKPANMKKAMFNSELGYKQKDIMDLYLDEWCKKVEKNLTYRFNVDYRTINNNWISELRKTYYNWEDDAFENKKETNNIKAYVNNVKKYKIIIKAEKISVEPSSLYMCEGEYIRTYVKFKIISHIGKPGEEDLLYCRSTNVKGLKKGVTIEGVFDIGIGSKNGYSKGEDYAVVDNALYQFK